MQSGQFCVISLGCAKNRVDSEEIIGSLVKNGYSLTAELNEADLVIINTCAFIREARKETIAAIKRAARLKKSSSARLDKIVVVGCLAGYYRESVIKKAIPQVDHVVPIDNYSSIPVILKNAPGQGRARSGVTKLSRAGSSSSKSIDRFLTGPPHSVYIKIAEGCNNRCSYCLIPSLRGRLRSRSIDEIAAEVRAVQRLGAREIILVAQDTTAYGLDYYGRFMLPELLQRLCALNGEIAWIRLMYAHPSHVTDTLLQVMATESKICKYIDIPIQHVSDSILELMGRKTTGKDIAALYHKMRTIVEGITLRTTVMVGYPGEGEREFEELLHFLEQHPFERLGAFIFSPERGTAAFGQGKPVSAEEASRRLHLVMSRQKEISRRFNKDLLGEKVAVIIDVPARKGKAAHARMPSQAPEVDGRVILSGASGMEQGTLSMARITAAGAYDLMGEMADNEPGQ